MRALALDFSSRTLKFFELPDPAPSGNQLLVRVAAAGVCGTDRELAHFRFGFPPAGESRLIVGHEALGRIDSSGDWVVPMVRRSCSPACRMCTRGRWDLCITGAYTERGIFGAHGFLADYVVLDRSEVVPVPPELVDIAVLVEPLTVVEKAVAMAVALHPGEPERAAVFGAGTIGILSALLLRQRGIQPVICSLEPGDSPRAALVRQAEIEWGPPGRPDIVIEAAGSSAAVQQGFAALAPNGVLIILGAPDPAPLPMIDFIAGNRVVAGSVNAGREHWIAAVQDLARLDRRTLDCLIHRVPFAAARDSVLDPAPPGAAPKLVHMLD